jgi:hypothetical protein
VRYAQAAPNEWGNARRIKIVPVRCGHINCAAALRRGSCERRNYSSESEAVEIASSEAVVSVPPRAKVAATSIVAGIRSEAVRRAGAGRLVELKAKASGRP